MEVNPIFGKIEAHIENLKKKFAPYEFNERIRRIRDHAITQLNNIKANFEKETFRKQMVYLPKRIKYIVKFAEDQLKVEVKGLKKDLPKVRAQLKKISGNFEKQKEAEKTQRIQVFKDYATSMVNALREQNKGLLSDEKANQIYKKVNSKIELLSSELERSKSPEELGKLIDKKEKEFVEVIRKAQIEFVTEIAAQDLRLPMEWTFKLFAIERSLEKIQKSPVLKDKSKIDSLLKSLVLYQLDKSFDIHNFINSLQSGIKEFGQVLREDPHLKKELRHIERMLNEMAKHRDEFVSKVRKIAEGKIGWGEWLFGSRALTAFKAAKQKMEDRFKEPIPQEIFDKIKTENAKNKHVQFEILAGKVKLGKKGKQSSQNLDRRAGVIGMDGIYKIAVEFDKDKLAKQFKSFKEQHSSETIRTTIKLSDVSKIVPANKELDGEIRLGGNTLSLVFEKMSGETMTSSHERAGRGLVNAQVYNYKDKDNDTNMTVIRHGVASIGKKVKDIDETDPAERIRTANNAARQLVKIAFMDQLSEHIFQGAGRFSIQDLQQYQEKYPNKPPFEVNLFSNSLLSPVGALSDTYMLMDHNQALKRLAEKPFIEIDVPVMENGVEKTYKIKCKLRTTGFTTAVNKWGQKVAKSKILTPLLESRNQEACKVLEGYVTETFKLDVDKDTKKVINDLMKDIRTLSEKEHSYISVTGNPFELQARVAVLINHLNLIRAKNGVPGISVSIFCMSGSDRTTVQNAVIDIFNDYYKKYQKYPTIDQFNSDPQLKADFALSLIQKLLDPGFREAQRVNKQVAGTKEVKGLLDFLKGFAGGNLDPSINEYIDRAFEAIEGYAGTVSS